MTERLTAEELKRWKDRLEASHTIPGFWQLTDRELGFFLAAAEEYERLRAAIEKHKRGHLASKSDDRELWEAIK